MIRIVALSIGAMLLIYAGIAIAQSTHEPGPTWSTIAGWIGGIAAFLLAGWATRIETMQSKVSDRIEAAEGEAARALEKLRSHYDARVAEALSKCAENTLKLSEIRLEQAQALLNYPTKTDFSSAMNKLDEQMGRINDRLDGFVNAHHANGGR